MIIITGTQEMYDRWQAHLKYASSLRGGTAWKKVTPEKANTVLYLYKVCGSVGKVSRDLHLARTTVNKILAAQGVPA